MIQMGSKVEWAWGNGTAQGKVIETHSETVTRTFQGNKVTRKGESGNKALVIRQKDGSQVLKLEKEVWKVS